MDEAGYALLRFYLCLTANPQTGAEKALRLDRLAYWRRTYAAAKKGGKCLPLPPSLETSKGPTWLRITNKYLPTSSDTLDNSESSTPDRKLVYQGVRLAGSSYSTKPGSSLSIRQRDMRRPNA